MFKLAQTIDIVGSGRNICSKTTRPDKGLVVSIIIKQFREMLTCEIFINISCQVSLPYILSTDGKNNMQFYPANMFHTTE